MSDVAEIKPGDVVVLKSGGPKMVAVPPTPQQGKNPDHIGLVWYFEGKLCHESVSTIALRLATADDR